METKPCALIILDGFGYTKKHAANAIYQAHTHIMQWFKTYPSSLLDASGPAVGLLKDMMGNSEVGHLTIGAGRIVEQPITLLHNAINDGSFFHNPIIIKRMQELKKSGGALHIMGLLSDAGVHSHEEVLYALLKMADAQGLKKIIVHPFLDGRDTPPKSAVKYLHHLDKILKNLKNAKIGSIHGRFYAMDRDKHYERTEQSYNVLTRGQKPNFFNWQAAIEHYYHDGITDEFIPPTQISRDAPLKKGDGLIFFNIREDRARQLTRALIDPHFNSFKTHELGLEWMITGISYHPDFNVDVLFNKETVYDTLLDVLQHAQKRLFTIAETEKYAHITYFFNGGREIMRPHETRILIPSKSSKMTYIDNPCMSAPEITQTVIKSLLHDTQDFYLINYANADMVGHSGDLNATIKAIECLDEQLVKLFDVLVTKKHGTMFIAADHGNAEDMVDPKTHQPKTSHTLNPVPFIMVQENLIGFDSKLPLKELSDIAPFILKHMGLDVPKVMKK